MQKATYAYAHIHILEKNPINLQVSCILQPCTQAWQQGQPCQATWHNKMLLFLHLTRLLFLLGATVSACGSVELSSGVQRALNLKQLGGNIGWQVERRATLRVKECTELRSREMHRVAKA